MLALVMMPMPLAWASPNTVVQARVNVTVPKNAALVSSSGASVENAAIPISIDNATLEATGQKNTRWNVTTNSSSGARVTIERTSVSVSKGASDAILNDIHVRCSASGGSVTPISKFSSGSSLNNIALNGEGLCSMAKAGTGTFDVTLSVRAPATDGNGNVNATLTMVVAAL